MLEAPERLAELATSTASDSGRTLVDAAHPDAPVARSPLSTCLRRRRHRRRRGGEPVGACPATRSTASSAGSSAPRSRLAGSEATEGQHLVDQASTRLDEISDLALTRPDDPDTTRLIEQTLDDFSDQAQRWRRRAHHVVRRHAPTRRASPTCATSPTTPPTTRPARCGHARPGSRRPRSTPPTSCPASTRTRATPAPTAARSPRWRSRRPSGSWQRRPRACSTSRRRRSPTTTLAAHASSRATDTSPDADHPDPGAAVGTSAVSAAT